MRSSGYEQVNSVSVKALAAEVQETASLAAPRLYGMIEI